MMARPLHVTPAASARLLSNGVQQASTPPAKHKYRAKRTTIDGVTFASKAEANRWQELCLLLRAGHITDLEYQPRYLLTVNDVVVGTYVADARYRDVLRDRIVVEDVKGVRTPVYRLKKKLMRACHGIDITEVQP